MISRDTDILPVSFNRVSKWFGNVVALSDVSFNISQGVTGILGPNGSGKTTLLRILAGLTPPSEGEAMLFDKPPREDPAIYKRLGVMSDHDSAYANMTGEHFLRTVGTLRGVSDLDAAVTRSLNYVDMSFAKARAIKSFSRGMRQRIRLAASLIHDPDILLLDEPLNGADPRQRLEFQDVLQDLGRIGKTVIVSSHILEELERISSQVIVIVSGKIAASGDVHGIRAAISDRPYSIRISVGKPREVAAALVRLESVESVEIDADSIVIYSLRPSELQRALPAISRDLGSRLNSVVPLDDTLESVFGYLAG